MPSMRATLGDLEVARELHLDEGALEVDDHRVGRVTRVQRDTPGGPSLRDAVVVLVDVLVVGEAGLEVDRRERAPPAPSTKPRFSATARMASEVSPGMPTSAKLSIVMFAATNAAGFEGVELRADEQAEVEVGQREPDGVRVLHQLARVVDVGVAPEPPCRRGAVDGVDDLER